MADYDPDRLQTEPAPASATMTVRPKLLDDKPNIAKYLLKDVVPKESGGKWNVIYGPGGGRPVDTDTHPHVHVPILSGPNKGKTTSAWGGLQFEADTWDRVAKKTGLNDASKDSQLANGVYLADETYRKITGRDLEKDLASDDKSLKAGINRAMGTQWESLAAGPRVSNLDASGRPRFSFSDYALKEHDGRPNTDVLMMSPQQYLDLSPELEGKPFESPSGRSLMKSFDRGDPIESVPTLDVNVDGPTAQVTDQDGRHRALLAQKEGIEAIPVAVRRTGEGDPKEIVGMNGVPMAHDFPKAADVRQPRQEQPEQPRETFSLIPGAQAAEPQRNAAGEPVDAAPTEFWKQGTTPVEEPTQQAGAGGEFWKQGTTPVEDASTEQSTRAKQSPVMNVVEDAALGGLTGGLAPPGLGQAIIKPEYAAAAARGMAPYAAGAAAGAALGAPFAGVGAIPGAAAGAAAVGIDQILTSLLGLKTPSDATNRLLDFAGVQKPATPEARIIENAAAGAANALAGAGAMTGLANALKNPLSKAVATMLGQRPLMQAISGAIGGASQQVAAEAGVGPTGQQIAGFMGALLPSVPGMARASVAINPKAAAVAARDAGYVLPPAEATEGSIGTLNPANALAGLSGKIKMGQYASAANQPVTNRLAATELGLQPDTLLTDQVFSDVRRDAGKAYAALKTIPVVLADNTYDAEINSIGAEARAAAQYFPGIIDVREIDAMRRELAGVQSVPTDSAVEVVKRLRFDSKANLRAREDPQKLALGLAQRRAAESVDDLIERNLAATGQDDLVDAYRAARQRIAKSYDIESVTNAATGDVSARGLGRLADKGKPLTGNLRTIANSANTFQRAFQNPAAFGGVEPLSILDIAFGASAAAHGHLGLASTIIGRPAARAGVLSSPFQNAMMNPRGISLPLSAATTPGIGTVPP